MENLIQEINRLKREKNAVILGHNYMDYGVQLVSDFTGDSYELAVKASRTNAGLIVFAGVYFMAEQAAAVNLGRKVLSPDPGAGCSLSDSLDVQTLQRFKSLYPKAPVVLYINTSIYAKALADYVVTSSNAVTVVSNLDSEVVLFGPDRNLANYVERKTGKKIVKVPPDGKCVVHANYLKQFVEIARRNFPKAVLMAHPESPMEVLEQADFVGSTSQMVRFAKESPFQEFIVATEIGMLNTFRLHVPNKTFYPLVNVASCACARCPYMAMITLEKVKRSLEEEVFRVEVPADVAERAKRAFENTVRLLQSVNKLRESPPPSFQTVRE
jgi:quinolinate synthase